MLFVDHPMEENNGIHTQIDIHRSNGRQMAWLTMFFVVVIVWLLLVFTFLTHEVLGSHEIHHFMYT